MFSSGHDNSTSNSKVKHPYNIMTAQFRAQVTSNPVVLRQIMTHLNAMDLINVRAVSKEWKKSANIEIRKRGPDFVSEIKKLSSESRKQLINKRDPHLSSFMEIMEAQRQQFKILARISEGLREIPQFCLCHQSQTRVENQNFALIHFIHNI
jgi:hypothetical protein